MKNIQWFPGHMAKTRRLIQSNLPLVDGIVEILDDSVKETLTEKINEMSDNALRVLGIAYKNTENIGDNVENDLIFTGLVGIIDPPKENVDKSIAACKKAGIKVRMNRRPSKNSSIYCP